jgi:hypothetical protein
MLRIKYIVFFLFFKSYRAGYLEVTYTVHKSATNAQGKS